MDERRESGELYPGGETAAGDTTLSAVEAEAKVRAAADAALETKVDGKLSKGTMEQLPERSTMNQVIAKMREFVKWATGATVIALMLGGASAARGDTAALGDLYPDDRVVTNIPPITALDFAGISVANAPWVATNAPISIIGQRGVTTISGAMLSIGAMFGLTPSITNSLLAPGGIINAHRSGDSYTLFYPEFRSGTIALSDDIPTTPAAVGAAPADLTNTVSRLFGYLLGSNVWFSVTNYQRTVAGIIPKMSLHELRDGANLTIWDQEEGLLELFKAATNYTDEAITAALADVPDRAWSLYTSGTGASAPSNVTWISTATTVFAGGLEYAKILTTEGFVCVLSSNGMTLNFGVATNGYAAFKADDGTSLLEFRKTASYTIGAQSTAITTAEDADGITHAFIPYTVPATQHPTVYTRAALDSGSWLAEDDSACLHHVTWTGSSGSWLAEVWGKTVLPQTFVKAEATVEGSILLHTDAKADLAGGILCADGVHAVIPVYTNNMVIWQLKQ